MSEELTVARREKVEGNVGSISIEASCDDSVKGATYRHLDQVTDTFMTKLPDGRTTVYGNPNKVLALAPGFSKLRRVADERQTRESSKRAENAMKIERTNVMVDAVREGKLWKLQNTTNAAAPCRQGKPVTGTFDEVLGTTPSERERTLGKRTREDAQFAQECPQVARKCPRENAQVVQEYPRKKICTTEQQCAIKQCDRPAEVSRSASCQSTAGTKHHAPLDNKSETDTKFLERIVKVIRDIETPEKKVPGTGSVSRTCVDIVGSETPRPQVETRPESPQSVSATGVLAKEYTLPVPNYKWADLMSFALSLTVAMALEMGVYEKISMEFVSREVDDSNALVLIRDFICAVLEEMRIAAAQSISDVTAEFASPYMLDHPLTADSVKAFKERLKHQAQHAYDKAGDGSEEGKLLAGRLSLADQRVLKGWKNEDPELYTQILRDIETRSAGILMILNPKTVSQEMLQKIIPNAPQCLEMAHDFVMLLSLMHQSDLLKTSK